MIYSNTQKAIFIISAFDYVIYLLYMYQIIIIPKNQNLFLCEDSQVFNLFDKKKKNINDFFETLLFFGYKLDYPDVNPWPT